VKVEPATEGRGEKSLDDIRRPVRWPDAAHLDGESGTVSTAELHERRATYTGPYPRRSTWLRGRKARQGHPRLVSFWLLRLQSDRSMKIDVDGFHLEQLGRVERGHPDGGPALVMDFARKKDHVIVWTE